MHPILAERRRLALHLIAWALVGDALGVLVHTILGAGWLPAFAFALPLALAAAPVSLSAWYLCRALPLARTSPVRAGLTAVLAAVVTASLWAAAGQWWWRTLAGWGLGLPDARMPVLAVLLVGLGAPAYLLTVTVHYLIQAGEASAAAARRALELQVAQRDAELRALRAQVDPHFLFNSLNAVAGLIGSAPAEAREMCQRLADFLRESLTLGAAPRIPLGREVALAEQYLRIEQVRFGRRLAVQTRVDEASAATPVPPLILQPLVENAVRHGIATCLAGGLVRIEAARFGPRVVVTVSNPREADGARRGTGLGQDLVRRRLQAAFGGEAALAVEPGPDAYRASVTVPVEAAARAPAGGGEAAHHD